MAELVDGISVDIDAADASATADKSKSATKDASVVVDADLAAKNGAAASVTPDEGLEKLKKQLEDERTARAAAETRAREAAQAEADARNRVQTTELDLVKNAISSVTQANDTLETKYAEALAAQDWGGAAKVQRQMTDNSAKLSTLEAGKTRLENAPKVAPRQAVDPVEAYIGNIGAEYPRSRAWVRSHPDFVTDPQKQRQMVAAHELAVARGYKADTDDYFKSVEKTLDLGGASTIHAPHADDPAPQAETAAAAAGGRQAAPAAAPVSRSGNGAGGRQNIVKLSAAEVEMAQNMGMTVEEYARNKVALKGEGKLS